MALIAGLALAVTGVLGGGGGGPSDQPPTTAAPYRPAATFRPYAADSPFNQALPAQPAIDPRSAQLVASITSSGPMASIKAIDGSQRSLSEDYSRPLYWSDADDPTYTVVCNRYGGRCPVAGQKVRIPAQARAAQGTDGHLTVIDRASGQEWSFFQVQYKHPDGGRLVVGWGAKIPITGDGIEGGGGAAEFGGMAGRIRYDELMLAMERKTALPHALFMVVRCTQAGAYVFPATKGEEKGQCPDGGGPEMGRRLWLDMTPEEIEALDVPEWRKVLARTMAQYGAYVGDIGGGWGFQFESGLTYLSFGVKNPFVTYAQQHPEGTVQGDGDGVTYYVMRDGIPWNERLRVLSPSATKASASDQ